MPCKLKVREKVYKITSYQKKERFEKLGMNDLNWKVTHKTGNEFHRHKKGLTVHASPCNA